MPQSLILCSECAVLGLVMLGAISIFYSLFCFNCTSYRNSKQFRGAFKNKFNPGSPFISSPGFCKCGHHFYSMSRMEGLHSVEWLILSFRAFIVVMSRSHTSPVTLLAVIYPVTLYSSPVPNGVFLGLCRKFSSS